MVSVSQKLQMASTPFAACRDHKRGQQNDKRRQAFRPARLAVAIS
jgi:hypothetical protein